LCFIFKLFAFFYFDREAAAFMIAISSCSLRLSSSSSSSSSSSLSRAYSRDFRDRAIPDARLKSKRKSFSGVQIVRAMMSASFDEFWGDRIRSKLNERTNGQRRRRGGERESLDYGQHDDEVVGVSSRSRDGLCRSTSSASSSTSAVSAGGGGGGGKYVTTTDASAILVPHPDKTEYGGEDSCFVLKRSNAFGVFDGVGGWSDEGVNAAEYAETFALEAANAVMKDGERNPVQVLCRAHERTKVVGSSTACVCVLEKGEAIFANLGDAGGIVARNGACVFKTEPMQHEFNMPYQLGWEEAYPETDDPRKADVKTVRLKSGDCIVLGSDGLWDNVPQEDVAILCKNNEFDSVKCAEQIARLAFARSVDDEYDSPFMVAARKDGLELTWSEKLQGLKLTGGKMDDIAVVVAFVA